MEDFNHGIIEYLKVFFRRKWFIIVPTYAGLILGICVSLTLPKEYASSMKILVQEEKNDNPLLSTIAVSTSAEQRIQTIRETMLGWDSLNELVKRLHLDTNIHNSTQLEKFIIKLQHDIEFKPDGNIIEIDYVSTNPVQAQAVVKNVTDIFIGRNVVAQNQETSDAIKFIEAQLHVYLGKIKSAEIADLKDKLNTLLIDSTEMHPQVKALRSDIQRKMEELKAQNLEYSEDAKLSAESTNPMITQIQQALANIGQKAISSSDDNDKAAIGTDKDLYKVMLMDKLDNVMARDVSVNENIYNSLLQRLETAKITQRLQSSKEGTRYTIIEDARIPSRPIRPNKVLVALGGLFFGLVIGIGLILGSEFLDKSFLDVQEASAYLNVPLLGAISKIETEQSIQDEKDRQKVLLFWMCVGGIALIIFTIIIVSLHIGTR